MDTLPTRESFELAAKLNDCGQIDNPVAATASAIELLETMLSIPSYAKLVSGCHDALHHCALIQGCPARHHALASIMSQMFAAGYAAGRQEIIDAELAKAQIFDLREGNHG